jgi:hypothetical protein
MVDDWMLYFPKGAIQENDWKIPGWPPSRTTPNKNTSNDDI